MLPSDEKQPETPPGSWTIATSWDGLEIPKSGLLSDLYTNSDTTYLYRSHAPFLWVKKFITGTTTLNADETGLAINTSEVKMLITLKAIK